ncbi:MAG: hypothetical protein ACXV46_04165 [Halobacteriota archaeon]
MADLNAFFTSSIAFPAIPGRSDAGMRGVNSTYVPNFFEIYAISDFCRNLKIYQVQHG